jgi:hypothetical protein
VRSRWPILALSIAFSCDGSADLLEPACDTPAVAPSKGACFLGGACNPVTGEPCGERACDLWVRDYTDLGYQCIDPTHTNETIASTDQPLCGTCSANVGVRYLCSPTLACLAGKCARYCCDDGDCGKDGRCEKEGILGGVGVCVRSNDAREGP